jgi:hypothetical protein
MGFLALGLGSVFFALVGLIFCIIGNFVSTRGETDRAKKGDNRSLVCIFSTMSCFCLWLQWICTYMHQMYPIKAPIPMVHEHGEVQGE